MSLRTRLLVVLSALMLIATLVASSIVYVVAEAELEATAETQLARAGLVMAELGQRRFDAELREFEHWADMPLVVDVARAPENAELVDAFERVFSEIVRREPYSSIFVLRAADGECIACDDPRRLRHPYARNVVSKQGSARRAFAGEATIGERMISSASGRVVVTLSAPIRYQGEVIAILRGGVDMDRLANELFGNIAGDRIGEIFLYDPSLPESLPSGTDLQAPATWESYRSPPEAMRRALRSGAADVFHCQVNGEEWMVAAGRMTAPPWVFLAARPAAAILAPIRILRRTMIAVTAVTLPFFCGALLLITAPAVRRIEQCRALATDIRDGRLDRRLYTKSSDETGQLAEDLNGMAEQLQVQRETLAAAEAKYRRLFENAADAILQTDRAGVIRAVNPAGVELLRAPHEAALLGSDAKTLYANPADRGKLLACLRAQSRVKDFEFDLCCLDGVTRRVVLQARAEHDIQGEVTVINSIVKDVTERREAEARIRQLRETEELLVRTKLEMLRYQINPHFLFNALNSLRELVATDSEAGVKMLDSLAEFCRKSLALSPKGISTVAAEIDHVRCFLEIQRVRFGERLRFSIDAADHVANTPMPAFVLQPLAENAVKYGRKSAAHSLRVEIRVELDSDQCVARVSNTGRWFDPGDTDGAPGLQLGLDNIRRRLAHRYGDDASLRMEQSDGIVTVIVRFPAAYPDTSGGTPC